MKKPIIKKMPRKAHSIKEKRRGEERRREEKGGEERAKSKKEKLLSISQQFEAASEYDWRTSGRPIVDVNNAHLGWTLGPGFPSLAASGAHIASIDESVCNFNGDWSVFVGIEWKREKEKGEMRVCVCVCVYGGRERNTREKLGCHGVR